MYIKSSSSLAPFPWPCVLVLTVRHGLLSIEEEEWEGVGEQICRESGNFKAIFTRRAVRPTQRPSFICHSDDETMMCLLSSECKNWVQTWQNVIGHFWREIFPPRGLFHMSQWWWEQQLSFYSDLLEAKQWGMRCTFGKYWLSHLLYNVGSKEMR